MTSVKDSDEFKICVKLLATLSDADEIEERIKELIDVAEKRAWGIGYAAGCEKGYQAGKSGK